MLDVTTESDAGLLEWALAYAASDFPVFPVHNPYERNDKLICTCQQGERCDSPAKHPMARLAPHGFQDASTDEGQIRAWWGEWKHANIGLAVPKGYVVLDLDGEEAVQAIRDREYAVPMNTPRARTSRGWHVWFQTNGHVIAPKTHLLPKVDLRGPGSYVVAPPSRHISGAAYRWLKSPSDIEFAYVPEWLVDLSQQRSGSGDPSQAYADRISVENTLQGVGEGERNTALFRMASKFLYGGVPFEYALKLAFEAAANCTPPLSPEEARLIVDSAYRRYKPSIQLESGQGRVVLLARDAVQITLDGPSGPVEFTFRDMQKSSSDALEAELTVALMQPGTSVNTYQTRINLMSHSGREGVRRELQHVISMDIKALTVLMNRAITEAREQFLKQPRAVRTSDIAAPRSIEYIVQDVFLDTERPTILFGQGGSLKTFVMMSMLLSIAAGEDWLGHKVQKRNCLLVDYESGQGTVGLRLRQLARALKLEDAMANIHWWDPDGVPLHDLGEALKRDVEQLNIGCVAIDHCAAACGSEPERSEAATRFYRTTSKLKLPVLALAHVTGSIADNPEAAKRPFGTIMWENGAALTWFVQKEEQGEHSPLATVGLFQRKWNDTGRLPDLSINFEFEPSEIRFERADLRESLSLRSTQGQKFILWDALQEPRDIDQLRETTGYSTNNLRAVLSRYKAMFEAVELPGRRLPVWQRRGDYRP